MVWRFLEPEKECDMTKLLLVVDEKCLLAALAHQVGCKVYREHRRSNAPLCAKHSDNAANPALRATVNRLHRVKPVQGSSQFCHVHRLGKKLRTSVANSAKQNARVQRGANSYDENLIQ